MSQEIKIATFNVEWMVNLFKNGKPVTGAGTRIVKSTNAKYMCH